MLARPRCLRAGCWLRWRPTSARLRRRRGCGRPGACVHLDLTGGSTEKDALAQARQVLSLLRLPCARMLAQSLTHTRGATCVRVSLLMHACAQHNACRYHEERALRLGDATAPSGPLLDACAAEPGSAAAPGPAAERWVCMQRGQAKGQGHNAWHASQRSNFSWQHSFTGQRAGGHAEQELSYALHCCPWEWSHTHNPYTHDPCLHLHLQAAPQHGRAGQQHARR